MSAAGIVLCGGLSSRMRRAKAWLPWRGRPMIAHVVERLREAVDEVVVVSSEKLDLPPLDAAVVFDREPELGPLAGIREGLAAIGSARAFVCGTDAPFIEAAFVRALLARSAAAGGGAVAPVSEGHVQTLCAVYPRGALARAEAMLEAGGRRPLHLLEEVGYVAVTEDELTNLECLRGFNTPDDYLAAARAAAGDPRACIEFFGRSRAAAGRRELATPIGTLGEVLAHAPPDLELLTGDGLSKHFLVSLEGRGFVRDLEMPVGPGEHVLVLDRSVGG